MLIDIPEQIKCSGCPFSEEGSGWCLLGEALDPKGSWFATDWTNKGWHLKDGEECRPDWCPLKATEKNWEDHWVGKSLGANVYQFENDLYFKEIDKGASYRIINKLIGGVIENV